jgi:hypothetical protein
MNNPNHPLYSALGGGSNIHLLDNMLFSAEQVNAYWRQPILRNVSYNVSVILQCKNSLVGLPKKGIFPLLKTPA